MVPRKRFSLARSATVLGTAALLIGLTACSGGTEPTDPSGPSVPLEEQGEITLRITWWGNPTRDPATQAAIDLFQEKYPNITVQAEPSTYDGYYDKLNTQLAAGDAPDVFQDGIFQGYAESGLLVDLGAAGVGTADIPQGLLDRTSLDGTLWELPTGLNIFGTIANEQYFSQQGVATPKNDIDWDAYGALAQKIADKANGEYYGATDDSWNIQVMELWLRQRGLEIYAEDGKSLGFSEKDLEEWWQFWADLREDGAVPTAEESQPASAGDPTKSPVATGDAAMGLWGTSTSLPASAGYAWSGIPGETQGEQPGSYLKNSVNWGAYSKGPHVDAAVALIDFLVNDIEAGKVQGIVRGVPANRLVQEAIIPDLSPAQAAISEYTLYVSQDGNYSAPPVAGPAKGNEVGNEVFVRHTQSVWFGSATIKQAAAAFFDEANALLAQG